MTRKDYIKFAEMFKGMDKDCNTFLAHAVNDELAQRASNIFAADNPNFDRARFLKACGVES